MEEKEKEDDVRVEEPEIFHLMSTRCARYASTSSAPSTPLVDNIYACQHV